MADERNTIGEVLQFAYEKEVEAEKFYRDWSHRVGTDEIREVLEEFAEEEKRHQIFIKEIMTAGGPAPAPGGAVADLRISDYLVEVVPGPEMGYQETLILAMQKEKAAFRLYSDLASKAESSETKNLFLRLAQEEAKHKLRFELIYDEEILKEN
jgi:rubrerythrin